ncbi:MAG: hypothetical protein AAFZ63_19725 [Bacteroidota bacterium]
MKTIFTNLFQNLMLNVNSTSLSLETLLIIIAAVVITYKAAMAYERYRRYKSFQKLMGGLLGRMSGGSSNERAAEGKSTTGSSFPFIQFIVALILIVLMFSQACESDQPQGYNGIQASDQLLLTTVPQQTDEPMTDTHHDNQPQEEPTGYEYEAYSVESWGSVDEYETEEAKTLEVQATSIEQTESSLGVHTLQIVASSRYDAVLEDALLLSKKFNLPIFIYRGTSLNHLLVGAFHDETERDRMRLLLEQEFKKKYLPKTLLDFDTNYLERIQ